MAEPKETTKQTQDRSAKRAKTTDAKPGVVQFDGFDSTDLVDGPDTPDHVQMVSRAKDGSADQHPSYEVLPGGTENHVAQELADDAAKAGEKQDGE